MFSKCSSLKKLNLSNFNTSNVTNMVLMFYRCSDDLKKKILAENKNIKKIKIIIDYQIKSFEKLFNKCKCIKTINFIKFNRNDINNMSYMFYRCSFLKELNLNNFNTNNVTNMDGMFCGCLSLKELNLNNFIIYRRIYKLGMFFGCSNELIMKIKSQYTNIKEEVFKN